MKLDEFDLALKTMSSVRDDLPVSTVRAFLWIARNQGKTLSELNRFLGISKAGTSRQINVLGRGMPGKQGLNLIFSRDNDFDRRLKEIYLTNEGTELYKALNFD